MPGHDEETFYKLVGRLYEIGLEADQWPTLLDEIAAHFGCVNSAYVLIDHHDAWRSVGIIRDPEPDSPKRLNCLNVYNELPANSDVFYKAVRNHENRHKPAVIGHQIVDRDELYASTHYNEVLAPAGLFDHLLMPISSPDSFDGVFCLYTNSQNRTFTEQDLASYSRLRPHLERLVKLQHKLGHALHVSKLTSGTLDAIDLSITLCTARGKIIFANKRAQALLTSHKGISERFGIFHIDNSSLRDDFQRRLQQACGENMGLAVPPIGSAMRISSENNRPELALHIYPFDPLIMASPTFSLAQERLAIISIVEPNSRPHHCTEILSAIFGLTPSEAKIAELLLNSLSQKEIALQLNISENTIRWHMKRLLSKTDCRREAELIGKLRSSIPPIDSANISP